MKQQGVMKSKLERVKVLPLGFPFTADKIWWEECVEDERKIEPIIGRNGWYFDRAYGGIAWIEINGEAWVDEDDNGEMWKLELEKLDHRPLRKRERAALKELHRQKLLCGKLLKLFNIDSFWHQLRNTYRGTRKVFL